MKHLRILMTVLVLIVTIHAYGQQLAQDVLDQFSISDRVECIIVMNDQLDLYGKTEGLTKDRKAQYVFGRLKQHAKTSQIECIAYLKNQGIRYKSFYIFNGIKASLTKDQADHIVKRFEVKSIVYDVPTPMLETVKYSENVDLRVDAEWGIRMIKADSVWLEGIMGQGVVIGGQDTGYEFDNTLIIDKYRGYTEDTIIHSYNWHDAIEAINPLNDSINDPLLNPCGLKSPIPCDDHGHGSHTMGTMVGRDSANYIGVAPMSKWIGCRNMERGYGTPSTYTECFEWFLAPTDIEGNNPDPYLAPHVINNSWGCPEIEGCNPDNWIFMETVVNNLSAAGTVVVVSAGNSGSQGCGSVSNPAAIFEQSFSVGATNDMDLKAGFSSIGPVTVDSSYRLKPDVVAPGVGVRSIYFNEEFRSWSGTSMAGPHVAGAVALVINANPNLAGEVDVIKQILKSTATILVDSTECGGATALTSPNFYYGYGRIDVAAAVKMAKSMISTSEEVNLPSLSVYPIPSIGRITIELEREGKLSNIRIYDTNGRLASFDLDIISPRKMEISSLSKGFYLYQVEVDGMLRGGKIIVQ